RLRPRPRSTLFPYTTLFRSAGEDAPGAVDGDAPCLGRDLAALTEGRDGVPLVVERREEALPTHEDSAAGRDGPRVLGHHRATSLDRKSTRLNSSHVKISYAV